MKKVLLTLLAFLAVGGAWAEDVSTTDVSGYDYAIYAEDITAVAGTTAKLPIYLKNAATVAAFQFSIVLPGDLAEPDNFAKAGLNPDRYAADNGGTVFDTNKQEDGSVMIIATVIEDNGFNVADAPILYLNLTIPSTMASGEYPIVIKATELSGIGGVATASEKISDEITSKLTITSTLALNEMDEKLPSFVDGSTATANVTRTIKNGQWSTVVLPFKLTQTNAKNIFGSASFAKLSKVVTTYEDDDNIPESIEIQFESFNLPRAGIAAGEIFLVKTDQDIETFTVEGAELANSISEVTGKDNEGSAYKLTGSYVKTVIPENGLFISDNKFYYSKGSTNIKGFRAWFELEAVLGQETPFAKVGFTVDGDVTSIDGLNIQRSLRGVYDLSGRKIELEGNDLNKLQKGVYIIDGKKVTIK